MKQKTAKVKRKKMPSKRWLIIQLDKRFSLRVKERDKYTCVICGTEQDPETKVFVQCSHIIGKGYKALRWDINNAVTHCFGCHKFFWHSPRTQYVAAMWFLKSYPQRSKRIMQIWKMEIQEPTRRELYDQYLQLL